MNNTYNSNLNHSENNVYSLYEIKRNIANLNNTANLYDVVDLNNIDLNNVDLNNADLNNDAKVYNDARVYNTFEFFNYVN